MTGPLCRYLFDDHERMDALLNQAGDNPEAIDMKAYTGFRQGLLRHIGIEEKIVLPAIARLQDGAQAEVAARLRLDHGALVALLVPPPTPAIVETIRSKKTRGDYTSSSIGSQERKPVICSRG